MYFSFEPGLKFLIFDIFSYLIDDSCYSWRYSLTQKIILELHRLTGFFKIFLLTSTHFSYIHLFFDQLSGFVDLDKDICYITLQERPQTYQWILEK